MSSTSARRNEYDYRRNYINHNSGIFKGMYYCSICHKRLAKEEMEVDHIVPLKRFGVNHIINCVATCSECNRKKGDKLGRDVLKQILWKLFEESIIGIRFIGKHATGLLRDNLTKILKYNLYDIKLGKLNINLYVYRVLIAIVLIFLIGGKL